MHRKYAAGNLGHHRRQDSQPAGPDQGSVGKEVKDDATDNDYLGRHRHQDSQPAGPAQGCDCKEAKDEDTNNDYTIDTIDTDNDYTIDDTATANFLFLISPHNPSVPTQAGAHEENAENAQEEEARNPLPIDDRKDTLDVATDPKDDNALAATSSAHHPRPRLHLRRQERRRVC